MKHISEPTLNVVNEVMMNFYLSGVDQAFEATKSSIGQARDQIAKDNLKRSDQFRDFALCLNQKVTNLIKSEIDLWEGSVDDAVDMVTAINHVFTIQGETARHFLEYMTKKMGDQAKHLNIKVEV